ncbi:MAG: 8-oxoguanine deaminase [Burkholderiales bacterium]|nr:8-oxoguanine deaminase [Burkholderiales bacterium]
MSGRSLLVEHAMVLVTMDAARREIADGALYSRDGVIEAVGTSAALRDWIAADPARAPARVVDARGCVVIPGLVNCHHHLYQTLTRAVGTGPGLALFDWLKALYPVWAEMGPEAVDVSTRIALAELMLSGATTVADHLYLFPNGARLDHSIDAAREMGVRFHATRGSMSVGESRGGLPPDRVCEEESAILDDCERLIGRYHDPKRHAMTRIALAPCSPFSVSADLMRESAALARSHAAVHLHTHLAETLDEERYCVARFGMRPIAYAASLGWLGNDVWFAHMVHPSPEEVALLGATATGICHCPQSNMILASGIAPVVQLRAAGARVGLGVDGSASGDGNQLLGEARQAMLLQRVGWPGFESRADRFSARDALELATLGGAAVLGRDDIGCLAPGMAADFAGYRVDDLAHAGALGDPVAALVTCAPQNAWFTFVDGRARVEEGKIAPDIDLPRLIERHNRIGAGMLARASWPQVGHRDPARRGGATTH